MQRAIVLLAFFFLQAKLVAQQYAFVHYTPREGLANNRARFIFQDSRGKLYISTYGGLSIYDGTRFTNYNTNNGLAASLVNDIVEMGEDSIWILPNANKINCLVKGKLKDISPADNFIPIINQLIKASNGYYYALADEGLFRLENTKFIRINLAGLPNEEAGKALIRGIEVNKKLFILTNPGFTSPYASNLLVYDLSEHKVEAFKENIGATYLFSPGGKELWVSTVEGLYTPDWSGLADKTIILRPLPDSLHIPRDVVPFYMYRDRQANTWLASGKGVYKITPQGETRIFTIENGLSTNTQTSVYQDFENNMWFTNEKTGICKLPNQELVYYPELKPGFVVTDIDIPSGDSAWFYDGYHHRVLLRLPGGENREFINVKSGTGPGRFVSANSEYLLSGTNIFLWKPEADNKQYKLILRYNDSNNTIGFNSGIRDRDGNLIAVSNKLVVLAGNKIISQPLHYIADHVTIDKQNRIWVATRSNTLFCFELSGSGDNIRLSLLKTYSTELPAGSPRSITADQSGNIWIGTRDHGLYRLHFDGLNLSSVRRLTTMNGLSDNFVSNLFCDNENNIWACTPSGLDKVRFTGSNSAVENITRSNNIYQPVIKIQQTRQGWFWILSNEGIYTYKPASIKLNNWKPALAFSETIINNVRNNTLVAGQELPHFKNNLSFQLSAPTYIDEKQTRFSYLLAGSGNNNWSEPSPNAFINFVNLPPGNYILKARASFLHGLYPDAESSFSFVILPPWWQTWWFRLLTVLLIFALVMLSLRYYINRKLEIQRVILEKKRAIEKERTRIATDMHDDLGAGLSRIKFLSDTIGLKKQQHLPIEEEISSIRTYSHEMIDKMGEIVWALNEKNDSLSDLLSYTRAYAVEYLQENGITCHVDEPDEIPHLVVNGEFRRNIYLTVKEALHNIVKHAGATEVFIHIDITTSQLSIQIEDNGKGIGETGLQSFGNGLFNMKARIEELKGNFQIINRNGTLIDMMVPLNL